MTIKLLVDTGLGKNISSTNSLLLVDTISEANKLVKGAIDGRTYSLIKGLSKNTNFRSVVASIREKYGIPRNGYGIEEWNQAKNKNNIQNIPTALWRAKVETESIREITKEFNIHPLLITSISDIVLLNLVRIPLKKIFIESIESNRQKYSPSAPKIVINGMVSKTELIKFIKDNFNEIEAELKKTDGIKITISDRSLRIIEQRDDNNKPFLQIADEIKEEVDDPEDRINENSVKEAYHKAKRRISSIKR